MRLPRKTKKAFWKMDNECTPKERKRIRKALDVITVHAVGGTVRTVRLGLGRIYTVRVRRKG